MMASGKVDKTALRGVLASEAVLTS
jgi:hypothetical protein